MFKRLTVVGLIALLLLTATVQLNPTAKTYLSSAPAMMTGMGAKLACSARYVSGFTVDRARADLLSYSPLLALLSLNYDDQRQQASASLLGLKTTKAQYRKGIGCSLNIGDTAHLDNLTVPSVQDLPSAWPRGNSTPDIDTDLQQLLDQILIRDNQQGLNTRALALIHKERLVAESYGQDITNKTQLLGWSMAKSIAAITIATLEADQKILTDETNLFAAWQGDKREQITLRSLMTMTSGLNFKEDYQPGADATNMLFAAHSASDYALQSAAEFTPGTHWSYSSGTSNLLSRLIHDRLGEDTQTTINYLHMRLLQPLAMADTTMELDSSGVHVGSSYVYASARDWARMGQLMLAGGSLNDQRIIAKDWVKRAVEPNRSKNDQRYGYQFWLNQGGQQLRWPDLPEDSYAALGNRKQVVMIIPSKQAVIVRLGWTEGSYPTNDNIAEILNAIP
ncbi:MAG: serine hydrolase [Candidatus Pelagadaptatus aseana]|uniref:serine hydrolase domain-containing protein n=1 Tax=Candidatus Pelagadaptatus aseana TaxID=3120508 RepID=UPI0039B27891